MKYLIIILLLTGCCKINQLEAENKAYYRIQKETEFKNECNKLNKCLNLKYDYIEDTLNNNIYCHIHVDSYIIEFNEKDNNLWKSLKVCELKGKLK